MDIVGNHVLVMQEGVNFFLIYHQVALRFDQTL